MRILRRRFVAFRAAKEDPEGAADSRLALHLDLAAAVLNDAVDRASPSPVPSPAAWW